MVRIGNQSLWVFRPGLTGHLEGSAPSQCIEVPGEVVGHHECQHVHLQRSGVGIAEGVDRCFLDRKVHALDLAIGPGVVDLGQTMLEAVQVADTIKNVSTETIREPVD